MGARRPIAAVALAGLAIAAAWPALRRRLDEARAEAVRQEEVRRGLAVRAERERIARDMHDGLAQLLAYVNTKSQAVEQLLAAGRAEEARRQLGELAAAARSIDAEVRDSILGLSWAITPERGLAAVLEEYGRRYAASSGLTIRFRATPQAVEAPLSPTAQAEIFQIAREALTNVRKHARASHVAIDLSRRDADVVLRITDDGAGFEAGWTGASGPPHFGLASMRERAASIGGRVAWRSRPGGGTVVELRLPLTQQAGRSGGRRPVSRHSGSGSAVSTTGKP